VFPVSVSATIKRSHFLFAGPRRWRLMCRFEGTLNWYYKLMDQLEFENKHKVLKQMPCQPPFSQVHACDLALLPFDMCAWNLHLGNHLANPLLPQPINRLSWMLLWSNVQVWTLRQRNWSPRCLPTQRHQISCYKTMGGSPRWSTEDLVGHGCAA